MWRSPLGSGACAGGLAHSFLLARLETESGIEASEKKENKSINPAKRLWLVLMFFIEKMGHVLLGEVKNMV